MSGPKALSCTEFKKALNDIFRLQHKIQKILNFLKRYKYLNNETGHTLDAEKFLKKNSKTGEKLCQTFRPEYMGTARENRMLIKHKETLENFLKICEREESQLKKSEQNYESYSKYCKHIQYCKESFQQYQSTAAKQIEETLSGDMAKNAATAIQEIKFHPTQEHFSETFITIQKQMIDKCNTMNKEALEQIDRIRMKYLDNSLQTAFIAEKPKQGTENSFQNQEQYQERQRLLLLLQQRIKQIPDIQVQSNFNQDLNKLITSKTFTDPYFYAELLDEIDLQENNRMKRQELEDMLHTLDEEQQPQSLLDLIQRFREKTAALLNKQKITDASMDSCREEWKSLSDTIHTKIEELAIQERQNMFLKQNLIDGLRALGYRMADETQIIDFTKTDDFILDIPNQENFLNIRFQKNKNDFLYNFLIPEEKGSLDSSQTKIKLNEMQSACDDFKKTLDELSDVGLTCKITRDIPVSEKAILQIPDRIRNMIQKTTAATITKDKQRYLDSSNN